jgi:hypothetical protein
MNNFQLAVINALGWIAVLTDGWITHTHYLAALGVALIVYSFWKVDVSPTKKGD